MCKQTKGEKWLIVGAKIEKLPLDAKWEIRTSEPVENIAETRLEPERFTIWKSSLFKFAHYYGREMADQGSPLSLHH